MPAIVFKSYDNDDRYRYKAFHSLESFYQYDFGDGLTGIHVRGLYYYKPTDVSFDDTVNSLVVLQNLEALADPDPIAIRFEEYCKKKSRKSDD